MNSNSMIELSVSKARLMAEKTIAGVKERRIVERKKYINKRMEELKKSWFRNLFNKTEVTEQEVLDSETDQLWNSTLWMIDNWRYGSYLELANSVLDGAQIGDTMYLTLEDVKTLTAFGT